MLARSALLLAVLASTAQAAPFDDLKEDLASCLQFEMNGARSSRGAPAASRADFALDRRAAEVDRLERADPRRARGDGGLSPSTKAVIQSVLGRGSGFMNARY